jgi:hypothetical protein
MAARQSVAERIPQHTQADDGTVAMPELNGHQSEPPPAADAEAQVIAEIKTMAKSVQVVERVNDGTTPFEQESHTLMLKSVDKITEQWIDELVALRKNSQIIEQMVIEQATKVKEELTKLHLLGVQAMREAQRGHEVLQHLGEEIETMMAERAA